MRLVVGVDAVQNERPIAMDFVAAGPRLPPGPHPELGTLFRGGGLRSGLSWAKVAQGASASVACRPVCTGPREGRASEESENALGNRALDVTRVENIGPLGAEDPDPGHRGAYIHATA